MSLPAGIGLIGKNGPTNTIKFLDATSSTLRPVGARVRLLVNTNTSLTVSGNITVIKPGQRFYSSKFKLTETPLSEGGSWTSWGINPPSTHCRSANGVLWGTMKFFDGNNFADSGACLSGFAPDHACRAIIVNTGNPTTREVELLVRSSITSNTRTGYELDLSPAFGLNVVRINGPDNDFTIATSGFPITNNPNVLFDDGAEWTWAADGFFLTATCNDIVVVNNLDIRTAFGGGLVLSTGNPAAGFWNDTGVDDNAAVFGWRDFAAYDKAA